jgi:hypothetical protein
VIGVLSTIKLNDQARGLAAEIDDVGFDRHLSAEFHAIQSAIPQPEP